MRKEDRMKNTIRSFLTLVVTFIAFLATDLVRGATAAFTEFVGFGSVENAINLYAVPNSTGMSVSVLEQTSEGENKLHVKGQLSANINFTTKEALDAFFRQQVELVAQGALTNTLVDKDALFKIFGVTDRGSWNLGILYSLYCIEYFHLVKDPDGSYRLPSFEGLEMVLATTMIFEIPGLEWARIEALPSISGSRIKFSTSEILFEEDSRFDVPNAINIKLGYGYIEIDTKLAVAGTNNMGNQIPETKIFLRSFQNIEGQMTFDITGGDPGRVLLAQEAPSPIGPWTDVGEKIVVPRNGYPLTWAYPTGISRFYRARSVNDVPF
ncbi:MAG: hypothetical protein US45_C0014G0003 [Candidatus Nomurabacteria bacterium GW2011_GWA1_37_20]|uniref:Uncharacterized protein n=1 Tax=Candidatus Nomurabacteria bacterium GW2011_GWA1_37_20 TaxID=1618729 RepID=A0A0G0H342_9BACT|nr:MAG: hypothetical protein US45_C0014G0003 [Candidatus Nomurabacteria bacterium GW2011_GWA1_37_20]